MSVRSRRLITRVLTPALLATLLVLDVAIGSNGLPNWISNASTKVGSSPEGAVRALMVLQFLGLTIPFVLPSLAGAIAWISFGALAFAGLADVASVLTGPGKGAIPMHFWLVPVVELAVGAAGLWGMNATAEAVRAARDGNNADAPAGSRLTAWRAMAVVALAGVALAIAPRLDVHARTSQLLGGVESVVFDPTTWEGKTIPGTGLARYLPALTPLTLEETKWIVFYQPTCGRCHAIFETYFAGDNEMKVIAVEVPHAPGETVLEGDKLGDIACLNCNRLALPSGYQWIGITSPTILRVENGTVKCVSWTDYDRCRMAKDAVPADAAPIVVPPTDETAR